MSKVVGLSSGCLGLCVLYGVFAHEPFLFRVWAYLLVVKHHHYVVDCGCDPLD